MRTKEIIHFREDCPDNPLFQDGTNFGRGGRRKVGVEKVFLLFFLQNESNSDLDVLKVLRRRPTAFENVPAVPEQRPSR